MVQETPISHISHILWPSIPDDINISILCFNQQLSQSQQWSAQRMAALQGENIINITRHARKEIPYYKKALQGLRHKMKQISRPIQWAKVPLLSPNLLIQNNAMLQTGLSWDMHGKAIKNTAFMGQKTPTSFLSNSYTRIVRKALLTRFYQWNKVDFTGKLIEISYQAKEEHHLPDWGLAIQTGKRVSLNAAMGPENIMLKLRKLKPDYISLPTNLLPELIKTLQKTTAAMSALRNIFYFGPPIPRNISDQWEDEVGVTITGRMDMPGLDNFASQCLHKNFHLNGEYYLMEILSSERKICAEGTAGRLFISTLHNYNMPLIRFDTGLTATRVGPCECGMTLPAFHINIEK